MDMLNRVIVRNQWLLETVSVVNTVLADDAAGKGRIFKELQRAGIANSNSSWSTNDAGDGGEGEASSSLATNFYKVTDSLMGLSNRVVETADTVVHYAESALGLQGHLDIAPKQSFLELGVSGLQANNVFILDQVGSGCRERGSLPRAQLTLHYLLRLRHRSAQRLFGEICTSSV